MRPPAAVLAIGIVWAASLMLGGCGVQTVVPAAGSAGKPGAALPLRAVYESEGDDRPVLFVDVTGASDEELDQVIDDLAAELGVEVLPGEAAVRSDPELPALTPMDPETGRIGISLTLESMAGVDQDRYEATVLYARSGLDGGYLKLVLEREAGEWEVTDVVPGPQS